LETDPKPLIRALRNSRDRLESIISSLTNEQLRQQSYDTDWTIAQVLSHLGSSAELGLQMLEADIEGVEPPGHETFTVVWDAWNARSAEEQAAAWREYDERSVRRFETLTESEIANLHVSRFGRELNAADFVRIRLTEHAIHTWDVEVVRESGARVAPDAVALIVDSLGWIASIVGKPQGKAFRLRVQTSDPERNFLLQTGESVTVADWDAGAADGELQIPAEAFVRLVYGRLDAAHTPEMAATGVDVTLDDLRNVFPGV
jgi:uncharacterized protein (TIGR03083 family)